MNLESTVKYHFAKTTLISDSPRATASEALTGTDIMAAMGMSQSRAAMGYSAFLGKMGISSNDREKAIELLAQYAMTRCDKVPALRKLEADIKPQVMQVLATYAFEDYSRSASSVKTCDCCHGVGFIQAEKMAMKYIGLPNFKERREVVNVLCQKCKGKGVVSAACNDCRGRGRSLNKEQTKKQGVPVIDNWKRCSGRGYERIPSTDAYSAVCILTDSITLDTWKKSVKRFYDELITKFDIEEAWAESQLKAITR